MRVSSRARAAVAACTVLVLVFLVALGSSRAGVHAGGQGPVLRAPVAVGDLGIALILATALVLAGLVYALWGGRRRRRDDGGLAAERPPVPWWHKLLLFALAMLPLAGLVTAVVVAAGRAHRAAGRRSLPVPRLLPTGTPAGVTPASPGASAVHWWFWGALAAVTVAAALILVLRRRRSRLPGNRAWRESTRPLPALIEESLAELEQERDPRRAVIRAYIGMEQALARHGLARRPFEAPQEYLSRALAAIRVSGPAGAQLTGLFQQARFSEHPIAIQMKQDAITALAAIRDELAEQAP